MVSQNKLFIVVIIELVIKNRSQVVLLSELKNAVRALRRLPLKLNVDIEVNFFDLIFDN